MILMGLRRAVSGIAVCRAGARYRHRAVRPRLRRSGSTASATAGVHACAERLVTNFDIWPYNTFTSRVTPEMIGAMSDSCQWFTSQFDPLMGQINDFNRYLGDRHDDYATGGAQRNADAVVANIDRSTAFLGPRVKPLIITNQPDNFGPYSPIFGGDSMTHLTFQLSRISDSIKRKDPSGVTHANIVSATGWANALRDSGACN